MFSLAFFRNVLKGQTEGQAPMVEINPIFEAVAEREGLKCEGLMERIATEGTLAHMSEIPDEVKEVFVCAHDISPEWHMQMQAAFQGHCDASISKTINFPETATVEDVETIYKMAFELDCKGVTVYRNGCRQHQPMALKDSDKKPAVGQAKEPEVEKEKVFTPLEPAVLPEITSGIRVRQLTPFGNMHINITVDPVTGREMEVFAQLGKGGDLANSDLEAICRMISLWLRSGGGLHHVVNQLHSIGSSLQVHTKDGKIMSLGDGIARGLRRYLRAKQDKGLVGLLIGDEALEALGRKPRDPDDGGTNGNGGGKAKNGNGAKPSVAGTAAATLERTAKSVPSRMDALGIQWQQTQYKVRCPDCQSELRFGEGCVTCDSCGFSKC
jgi:ribonucleoside-diphosphate reductase alpha chain